MWFVRFSLTDNASSVFLSYQSRKTVIATLTTDKYHIMQHRKESMASELGKTMDEFSTFIPRANEDNNFWTRYKDPIYPFSQVLRLRVLQIVCGILVMIMGSVACIEEKGTMTNLGLGVFSGLATVVASASCIHTSRGFSGYRQTSCSPDSILRFLGPTLHVATLLTFFWIVACCLDIALFIRSVLTIVHASESVSETSYFLALVQGGLCGAVLLTVIFIARIDCTYDPD